MKKYKIIIIILILVSFVSYPIFVSAEDAPDGGGLQSVFANINKASDKGGDDMNAASGYHSLAKLASGHSNIVGVMISVIHYHPREDSAPEEETVSKIYYGGGSLGGGSESYAAQDTWDTVNWHKAQKANGNYIACSSLSNPLYVSNALIEISYSGTSVNHLFGDFPVIVRPFNFNIGGVVANSVDSIQYAVFARKTANQVSGLIEKEFFKGEPLNFHNKKQVGEFMEYLGMDASTDKLIDEFILEFENYYFKVEPVFRNYPPVLKKSDAVSGSGPSIKVGDKMVYFAPAGNGKYTDTSDSFMKAWTEVKTDSGEDKQDTIYSDKSDDADNPCPGKTVCGGYCCTYPDIDCYYKWYSRTFSMTFENVPTSTSIPRGGAGNVAQMSRFFSSYKTATNLKPSVGVNGETLYDNAGRKLYDCICGPTYKTALGNAPGGSTGCNSDHKFNSKYNYYKLVGNRPTSSDLADWKNTAVGMWLASFTDFGGVGTDCLKKCKPLEDPDSVDHSSDEYLRCAQSFCDANIPHTDNSTDEKRKCILDWCKYKPKDPIDCSNLSEEAQELVDISNAEKSNATGEFDTKCGYVSGGVAKTKNNAVGSYYDCKRYGDFIKEPQNGVNSYYYGVANADNTYINVLCKENSRLQFPDISKDKIDPGVGYYYPVKLYGNRQCLYFFDTVSWTFDFASTHSLDKVRKRLLLQKVEAFNLLNGQNTIDDQINGNDLLGKKIYYDIIEGVQSSDLRKVTLEEVEGKVPTSANLLYSDSLDKVDITAKTQEYVNKALYTDGYKFYNGGGSIVLERTNNNSDDDKYKTGSLAFANSFSMNEYYKFTKGSNLEKDREIPEVIDTVTVNSYNLTSSYEADYELPKVCIDDENKRKVSLANESGMCPSTNYETKEGLREYYTDLKYENHETYNNIISTSKIYKTDMDGVTLSESYLNIEDTCHYDYDPKISCTIHFNKKDDKCYLNHSTVVGCVNNLTASIIIDNNTTDKYNIVEQKMIYNGSEYSGVWEIPISMKNPVVAVSETGESVLNNKVEVIGKVKVADSDGNETTISCEDSINVINTCGDHCTITQESGTDKFKITGPTGSEVMVTTTLKTDTQDNLLLQKVTEDEDGNYYYTSLVRPDLESIIAVISNGTMSEQMQGLKEQRRAIENRLSAAKTAIENAEAEYKVRKRQYDKRAREIISEKANIAAQKNELNNQLNTLKAEKNQYEQRIAQIRQQMAPIQQQITTLQQQIAALSNNNDRGYNNWQINNIQNHIQNLENQLRPYESQIQQFESKLQVTNQKINSINAQITSLDNRIPQLDAEEIANKAELERYINNITAANENYNTIYEEYLEKKKEINALSASMFENGFACSLDFETCYKYRCTDLYQPDEKLKIKNYCEKMWSKDYEGYEDEIECKTHCGLGPLCLENSPSPVCCLTDLSAADREKIEIVEDYCDRNSDDEETRMKCITQCYQENKNSENINYRPINLLNPFPYSRYSDDDSSTYYAGTRKVGVEWVAAHKTIKEDIDQINREENIEYKITLNPSNIREIVQDTISNNSDLASDSISGTILTYTTNGLPTRQGTCGTTGYTGYCSEFIHSGSGAGFRNLFSIIRGVTYNAGG